LRLQMAGRLEIVWKSPWRMYEGYRSAADQPLVRSMERLATRLMHRSQSTPAQDRERSNRIEGLLRDNRNGFVDRESIFAS